MEFDPSLRLVVFDRIGVQVVNHLFHECAVTPPHHVGLNLVFNLYFRVIVNGFFCQVLHKCTEFKVTQVMSQHIGIGFGQ